MTATRKKPVDLEKSLAELEGIVELLEAGEQPLEKSLRDFERAVRLSRECETALKDAEQRVQVLLGGGLQEFAGEPDGGGGEDEEDDNDD
ncbi:MAG: exodeoxyribonuclease VII small subunit [Chromatiales bacterium]|jgi:exodeoxyribonuclease VII small subunit|nr:exodeoxyribonuclease VII small subunit [Chromatiales bacterium]